MSRLGDAARFAVNILDEDQQDLSSCFARNGRDRFEGVEWRPGETGAPILPGAGARRKEVRGLHEEGSGGGGTYAGQWNQAR